MTLHCHGQQSYVAIVNLFTPNETVSKCGEISLKLLFEHLKWPIPTKVTKENLLDQFEILRESLNDDATPEAKKKAQLLISKFRIAKETKATKSAVNAMKQTQDKRNLALYEGNLFLIVKYLKRGVTRLPRIIRLPRRARKQKMKMALQMMVFISFYC